MGSNVFLASSECLSDVESCVVHYNFTPFCYCGAATSAISLLVITVGREDDLFHSHCNYEVYKSYFCFFYKNFLELPYLLTLRGRTESIINVDVLFTF